MAEIIEMAEGVEPIKGFMVGDQVIQYDYNALANKPAIINEVDSSDSEKEEIIRISNHVYIGEDDSLEERDLHVYGNAFFEGQVIASNYINSSKIATKFTGLKVLVTGDSITEENHTSGKPWHGYLEDWLGFGNVYNDGLSDTGLVKPQGWNPNNKGIVDRISTYDNNYGGDFDLILIMGNMNDLAGFILNEGTAEEIDHSEGLPVGTFDQNTEADRYSSVYGAMHYILKTLINRYPNTPIGFISSTPRWNCYGTDSKFSEYMPALKRVCEHYSVPFLDLYSNSQLRPWNGTNRAKFFSYGNITTGDGIHPNAEGHYLMARAILPFVEQYCSPIDTKNVIENKPLISCTGISLPVSLSLDPRYSETLIPSVTPSNTTDIIRWTSSDNTVATVSDGTVTAIGGGECTITANCGNYEAECSVNVSTLMYSLRAETEFTGIEGSIDTGVKLMDADRDFTMLIEFAGGNSDGTNGNIDSVVNRNNPNVFSCVNNDNNGFALYILHTDNKYRLNYFGANMGMVVNDTKTYRFVFRHTAGTNKIMTSMASLMAQYPDGYPLETTGAFTPFDNTLRLGNTPESADYWYGRIHDFKVWYEVLDNETVGELLA